MTPRYEGKPAHLAALQQRIRNLAEGQVFDRVQRALANVIVSQMLPAGVVKGGAAMKLRLGNTGSRFTADLDVARTTTMGDFATDFQQRLANGWQGFTGRLVARKGPSPEKVPPAYIMKPFDVKLMYRSRSWSTVPVEVGHDELGDTDHPEYRMAEDLRQLLLNIGFDTPIAVPVVATEHQIAQKIHACSEPNSERAHDLVDLQLLMHFEAHDMTLAARLCRRLFISRKKHLWPPTVLAGADWPSLYDEAASGLDVLATVEEAVEWTNQTIARLDAQPG